MNIIEVVKATGKTKWFGTHPDGTNDFLGVEFTPEQLERFVDTIRKLAFVETAAIVLNSPSRDAAVDELERRAK